MITVVIADDHVMVRDGLRRTLEDSTDIRVVGEAGSFGDLLTLLSSKTADVALVDISMPGQGFLEAMRRLKSDHPSVRVVVVTARDDPEYAIRSFRAGALAYVDKAQSGEELVHAVRRASRGSTYLTEAQSSWVLRALSRRGDGGGAADLSEREFQVLGMFAAGKSVKEMAAALGVSAKTVSTYRARLLTKLKLRTTAELIRFALERDIGP